MTDPGRDALRRAFASWDGFLALGFGAGLAPRAPGTVGTLVAVPLAWGLAALPNAAFWTLLVLAFLLGTWVCDRVGRRLGVADHGALVWDEFVGYWISVAFLPVQWGWFIAAFVLFRLLDILKPWPIRALERRVAGGLGVMLDDLVAGALAGAVLWLAARWLPVLGVTLPGSS